MTFGLYNSVDRIICRHLMFLQTMMFRPCACFVHEVICCLFIRILVILCFLSIHFFFFYSCRRQKIKIDLISCFFKKLYRNIVILYLSGRDTHVVKIWHGECKEMQSYGCRKWNLPVFILAVVLEYVTHMQCCELWGYIYVPQKIFFTFLILNLIPRAPM